MSSYDVGLQEHFSILCPSLSVGEILSCLAILLLRHLHIVVPELVYSSIQQSKGAAHLLGLASDEVLLQLLTLKLEDPGL